MSMKERTGFRSLVYSLWHRADSTGRYLGPVAAAKLKNIDIDSCEACPYCSLPVALIETAHTTAEPKNAPITALLAWMAKIPAYSVSYSGAINRSRCDACGGLSESGEIERFLVRRIHPHDPWTSSMTPDEYAQFLLSLRNDHTCPPRTAR